MTPEILQELIRHCGNEIGQGPWEQPPAKMIEDGGRFAAANRVMYNLLDALAQRCKTPDASKA
jgi:hypothetical protein